VPRLRLPRATIRDAMGWLEPGGTRAPSGARAICNWDEDALTLAVEAGRECLRGAAAPPQAVTLVSTTLPFVDRSNATLVAAALDLAPETQTLDVTGTLRAATTALAQAAGRSDGMRTLVIAADARTARPGSAQELEFGSAAVALLVSSATPSGPQSALADIRGVAHLSADLVDHYRASGEAFDYALEERWVRDEGLAKLVPDTVRMALERAAVKSSDVQHCVLPVAPAAAQRLLRSLGLDQAQLADALREDCGDSGAAHPLLMLAAALEAAAPGDHILLVGFGQGVDALVLSVPREREAPPRPQLAAALARRREEGSYTRYLAHRGLLDVDFGKRAERDNRSAQSVMWRKQRQLAGFVGGRCAACGTVQFPKSRVCVNPACRHTDTQADFRLAELAGRVKTFTEDWQAFAPRPPAIYGNVEFEGGGNLLMELTDTEAGEARIGMPVRFVFRLKDVDNLRAFRRYFWKATGV
jgi:3-hydroxy-3-methylglutaryl CoA synthase